MNKHIFHHEKQPLDKSTVYDGSTEDPQDHASFYKNVPKRNLFNVIAIPALMWLLLGYISAKFNIGQGDLKPHTWEVMDLATAVVLMYWSALLFEWIWCESYNYVITKDLAWVGGFVCSATFIGSGLYIFKLAIEFIQFVIELLNK